MPFPGVLPDLAEFPVRSHAKQIQGCFANKATCALDLCNPCIRIQIPFRISSEDCLNNMACFCPCAFLAFVRICAHSVASRRSGQTSHGVNG